MTANAPVESVPRMGERVFLVVVDDTQEMRNALRYACRRAQHTNGRVALLHVGEPVEFQHWLGVGEMMEEEARREAEQRLQSLAGDVFAQTGTMPVLHVRQGSRMEELLKLIAEDPTISQLVLGMASEGGTPGPLVTHLVTGMRGKLRVPITLVPGQLSPEEVDLVS